MTVTSYEGVVENGQIRLTNGVVLPEHQSVIVVLLPNPSDSQTLKVPGIRLANPEDSKYFEKTVTWGVE
jgi:hypothetical protein